MWYVQKIHQYLWIRYVDNIAKTFCSRCGSSLISLILDNPDVIGVPLGGLEQDPGNRVQAHIFVASKAPWHEITDDIPQYDKWPQESANLVRGTRWLWHGVYGKVLIASGERYAHFERFFMRTHYCEPAIFNAFPICTSLRGMPKAWRGNLPKWLGSLLNALPCLKQMSGLIWRSPRHTFGVPRDDS